MVVWLFAGGGETEVRGLVPFFEKHFPEYRFERKSPVRKKPGPRPGVTSQKGYGLTGKGFVKDFSKRLKNSFIESEKCNIILVIDDLNCKDCSEQTARYLKTIDSVEEAKDIKKHIGFAAPEIESWIIADWNRSIALHPDFRNRHTAMRHWLSKEKNIAFDAPESFGNYDASRDTCDEKMSKALQESTEISIEDKSRYSKAIHTPYLLSKIDPVEVSKKCPLFKELFVFLKQNSNN